jgi:hypothetical protein
MTRDEIIRMAQEAGFTPQREEWVFTEMLERFAALVAAAERNRMIADGWRQCAQGQRTTQFCAVAEQAWEAAHEACAKVCDPYTHGQWFAAAIRAQAADRLARHGIQLPDEGEEYGNPSF